MSTIVSREMVMQLTAVLFACVGGWMMLVEPKIAELRQLEAAAADAGDEQTLAAQNEVTRMADRLQAVRRRVTEVEAQNAIAGESARMYAFIMDRAAEHGVAVQRLDPKHSRRDAPQQDATRITAFNMTIEGEFEQVAAFLDAVAGIGRFIRPVTLHVTPLLKDGRPMVTARFTCEALCFTLPQALAAMAQGPQVDE